MATGISFVLFGAGTLLMSLVFLVFVRLAPVSQSTKQRWILSCIKGLSAFFVGFMQFLGLYTLEVRGQSLDSIRGNLIVANHPSLIDALFITAKTNDLCCVVKADLYSNPFTGYIVKLAGYIPNHSETLLNDAASAISQGKNLLIFPEGTRNTFDDQLDFKRGAANVALYSCCPITPVVIEFYPRNLQKGGKWYIAPARTSTIIMTTYPPLANLDEKDQQRPVTLQARQLTQTLRDFYQDRINEFDSRTDYTLVERGYPRHAG